MASEIKRPGGELATRPLHLIWICDCSGSMGYEGKIQSLNRAIREATPHMKKAADGNPNAQVYIRAIKFSGGAQWHITQPTPADAFEWVDLDAEPDVTAMGKALSMVADQLTIPPMEERAFPPVLVLVSDGRPTDDFAGGLQALMNKPWGKKAVRIAVAIGRDADTDVLQKFIGNPEFRPLEAKNPDQLVRYIKWASTEVLKSVSAPSSQAVGGISGQINVPIPSAPEPGAADDVW